MNLHKRKSVQVFAWAIMSILLIGLLFSLNELYISKPDEHNKVELVMVIYLYGSNPTWFQTSSKIELTKTFVREAEHDFGIYTYLWLRWYYDNISYQFIDYLLYDEY